MELLGTAVDSLTARQKHIVAVIGETDNMAEAAAALGVHPSALSAKLRAIANRLGLAATNDLVQLARRRQVLDASSQAVIGIDARGMCVFANRRTAEMMGYSRAELVGQCLHDLIHVPPGQGADTRSEDCPVTAVALGKGLTHSGETVLFHRDGSPLWVSYSAVAAGESGEASVTVVTWSDHSAEIKMERELSKVNERLEMALDAGGITAFEVDLDSQQVTGWGRLLAHQGGAGLEQFVDGVRPAPGYDLTLDRLPEIPVGATAEAEYSVQLPGSEMRDARIRVRRLAASDSEPARLIGVAVDVTAVRDVERVHEAVLELSNDALIGTDAWGTVVKWNGAAEKLFGYSKQQALGAPVADLVLPERSRPAHAEAVRSVRERAVLRPISLGPFESTTMDSSGREFPVEWSVTWVPMRDGMMSRAFLRDISERKAAEAELRSGALADQLTGLANRAVLEDRLAHAQARMSVPGTSLAVMFVDVDRFKLVNDSLGHAAGDTVLREVAARMSASVRTADTVGRFGGDEFVVICEDISEHDAMRLAERMITEIQKPFPIDGLEIAVSASIGIAMTTGLPGAAPDDLLRDADAAMYRAKELGKGRAEMFSVAVRDRALRRLRMETDLRRALTADELRVFYQPIVDTRTEQICGVEALVRWEHPEHGLLPPSEFISLAEDTGLIVALGAWVLRNACLDVASWPVTDDFHVTVNLAAKQLQQDDLFETVTAALDQARLLPSQLCLEITETGMMEESRTVMANLDRIHGLGVGIAIDDFGTGYSSLLRLRRFPIDMLKIDRLFVSGIGRNSDDTAILAGIAELARALRVETLAEGVETPEQLHFMRSLGCHRAQGFRWSPAVEEPALRDLLSLPHLRPPEPQPMPFRPGVPMSLPAMELAPPASRRRRVVLVDDSPGDRSLIGHTLSLSGTFEVVGEAESAEEALGVVGRETPDLILLDMSLPGADGLSALASLRQVSPSSVVALLSGFTSSGLERAALAAGAAACLDKGISAARLLSELVTLFPGNVHQVA